MTIKYGALEMIQAEWQKAFEDGDGRLRAEKIKTHGQLQDYRKLIKSGMVTSSGLRYIKYNNDKLKTWKEVFDANIQTPK